MYIRTPLKEVSYRVVKNEKARMLLHNIYHRMKIIRDMFKRKVFVPCFPIEHFHSPFPALADVEGCYPSSVPRDIPGVDLNAEGQFSVLDEIEPFYKEMPFKEEQVPGLRYCFESDAYRYSDAIFLHCMIRKAKPQRIIEVGSGFSSCVMLDTNELFFDNKINCTFIEPNPKLLKSLIKETDFPNITINESKLENIPLSFFAELKSNDILFIDSTHVSRFNSDVNYVIHQILPVLAEGVYIHFHDIFYPFEYPKDWLLKGYAWNEQYMLRAFLEYNTKFKIVLFNTYLEFIFPDKLKDRFPLIFKDTGGSIWIKKV